MNQAQLRPVFAAWSPDAVIGDGASAHRAKRMGDIGLERIFLPSYSPELNPAERIFEELRRAIEGQVYPSLNAKRRAIEHYLRRLRAHKPQLRPLLDGEWIRQAFEQLPDPYCRPLYSELV
jgi:hypothetical protein